MQKNFEIIGRIEFPKPTMIDINMMPFILGNKNSIPKAYQHYMPIIDACNVPNEFLNKIVYLTIKETQIQSGKVQRIPGIHIDIGYGTVYIANSMTNTALVYDKKVTNSKSDGDCEFLRGNLGEGTLLNSDTLYCMLETTPHESLPVHKNGIRQFFRLATGPVKELWSGFWTENPLGIKPECIITEKP